jgi:ribosomal protein S18 acetylase RimI-like enzyme
MREILTAREQYEALNPLPWRTANEDKYSLPWRTANEDKYSLPSMWNDYVDYSGGDHDLAKATVQRWGNVDSYLDDRHGIPQSAQNGQPIEEWLDHKYNHPATLSMAKLHALAQSRTWMDGYQDTDHYDLQDSDLLQGAALGLLRLRRNNHTKALEPHQNCAWCGSPDSTYEDDETEPMCHDCRIESPEQRHINSIFFEGKKASTGRVAGTEGDLPPGLSFSHDDGQTHAYDDDKLIGYLRPHQGKIDMIKVIPDYRRRGVATAMLNWHRENVDPNLQHSKDQTPLGRAWGKSMGWEPPDWKKQPEDVDYIADYEVPKSVRKKTSTARSPWRVAATEKGKWYHASPHELPVGTVLTPGGGESQYKDTFYKRIQDADTRRQHVWVDTLKNVRRRWSDPEHHIYEVEPHEEPQLWWDTNHNGVTVGGEHGYTVPAATIKRLVRRGIPRIGKAYTAANGKAKRRTAGGTHTARNPLRLAYYGDGYRSNPNTPSGLPLLGEPTPELTNEESQELYDQNTQNDIVGRMDREFHDWAYGNNKENPYDTEDTPGWHGEPRGPIGYWPHIEDFLREKYPAAHRGLNLGMEEAGYLMDVAPYGGYGRPRYDPSQETPSARHYKGELGTVDEMEPYETGHEAVEKYGYDPKEVVAALMLLHSDSSSKRKSRMKNGVPKFQQEDLDRLHDIAVKRFKNQRQYESENNGRRSPRDIVAAAQRLLAAWADDSSKLIDGLHDEFHDWWNTEGEKNFVPPYPADVPNGHNLPWKEWDSYESGGENKPLSVWPNIESFLSNRYPAAYRGQSMGQEMARPLIDSPKEVAWEKRPEYETGPEAVAKHGYDPKEIAAAMLLLHNRSHGIRTDLEQGDLDRLSEIARTRSQMQRNAYRIAMPTWYHASPHEMQPGTVLTPGGGSSMWEDLLYKHFDPQEAAWRKSRVWVEKDPWIWGGSDMPFVYEVKPHDRPLRAEEPGDGYHASAATIIKLISRDGGDTWLDEEEE